MIFARLRFAGRYSDPNTGLIYLRARWYDPGTGQFMSVDPLVAQTQQPYQYGGDDPINETDPSGLIFGIPGTPSASQFVNGAVHVAGRIVATGIEYSPLGIALSAASRLSGLTIGDACRRAEPLRE